MLRKEFMDVSSHGEVPTPLVQVALGCCESMGILIPHGTYALTKMESTSWSTNQLKLLTNVALSLATAPWYFPWMWEKHRKTEFSQKMWNCHQQVDCFFQKNVGGFTPKTWEFFLSPGPSILGPRPIVHEGLPGFCLRCWMFLHCGGWCGKSIKWWILNGWI